MERKSHLAQDVLLDLVVVDVGQPVGLLAAHLLHLRPLEELVRPPGSNFVKLFTVVIYKCP